MSNNDFGVLLNSKMGKNFEEDSFHVPAPEKTHDFSKEMPFFLACGKIFPLKHWLMRPYVGKQLTDEIRKVFNCRLSQVLRIIENNFGILVSRWTILQREIEGTPEKIDKIVLATIVLHNYLIRLTMQTILRQGLLIQRIVLVRLLQDNGESISPRTFKNFVLLETQDIKAMD